MITSDKLNITIQTTIADNSYNPPRLNKREFPCHPEIALRFTVLEKGQILVTTTPDTFDIMANSMCAYLLTESFMNEKQRDEFRNAREYWKELSNADMLFYWIHYTIGTGKGMYCNGINENTSFADYVIASANESAYDKAHDC